MVRILLLSMLASLTDISSSLPNVTKAVDLAVVVVVERLHRPLEMPPQSPLPGNLSQSPFRHELSFPVPPSSTVMQVQLIVIGMPVQFDSLSLVSISSQTVG